MTLVKNTLNFVQRYALRYRWIDQVLRQFRRREHHGYTCITCNLPYTPPQASIWPRVRTSLAERVEVRSMPSADAATH